MLTNVTASSLEKYQLLDILPYNNDVRGSKFSGNYKVSNITINQIDNNNYYIYKTNIKVKYIDIDTKKEIDKTITKDGYDGETYKTEPKEIKGYKLVEEPANKEGKMRENTIEVIYLYKKEEEKSKEGQTTEESKKEDKIEETKTEETKKTSTNKTETKAEEKEQSTISDKTTAEGRLPQTGGNKIIILAIVVMAGGAVIAFVKVRNYKDIC